MKDLSFFPYERKKEQFLHSLLNARTGKSTITLCKRRVITL